MGFWNFNELVDWNTCIKAAKECGCTGQCVGTPTALLFVVLFAFFLIIIIIIKFIGFLFPFDIDQHQKKIKQKAGDVVE